MSGKHVKSPLEKHLRSHFEVGLRIDLAGQPLAPEHEFAPPQAIRLMHSGGRGTASTDGLYWSSMVMTALPSPHGVIDSTPGMLLNLQNHESER